MLKAQVQKLMAKQNALLQLRDRLGVNHMTDAELIVLARELRAAEIPAWAIAHLTGLTHREDKHGPDQIKL